MAETAQELFADLAEVDDAGVLFEDQSWTWREFIAAATQRAHVLAEYREPEGRLHVGVLMQNTPEMLMAIAAGALGGHVTAGINNTRRGEALAKDVRRADCAVVLTDTQHLPLLDGLELGGADVINTDDAAWHERAGAASTDRSAFPVAGAFDNFMLIFTSGTSGDPKAVQVSHFAVVMSGASLVDRFALGRDAVCYASMPLFHSNAILAGIAPALYATGSVALARTFSASTFLADIRRHKVTYLNYVGKPLAYVLATEEQPDDADNTLQVAFGNEASDRDIAEFQRRFDCAVWDGFGSTELAVIIVRPDDTPAGSIGQPFEGVAVYNRETQTECPRAIFDETGAVANLDDAVGELVNTQGAGFFGGYYNDESATSERMANGMYWSGDLAYRDEAGFVYLAGRTSDWLRVDGENLAAAPIEAILLRHPAISQAAVYAVPDPQVGDQLMVAVVLRGDLSPESFGAFLAEQPDLSPKAWPRYVRLATELPSTATNKVLKRELTVEALAHTDPQWTRGERDRIYVPTSEVAS